MKADEQVITSVKDPAIAQARRSVGQAGRGEPTSFLVDGRRLAVQALDAGAPIEVMLFLDPVEKEMVGLLARARECGIDCRRVTRGVFFRVLGLGYETSVRVLAVVRRPPNRDAAALAGETACVLAGEAIQDPRNVGVMIRTADAWSLGGCVFGSDSADPWSRASIRSTTGSAFRVPTVLSDRFVDDLERLKARGMRVVGTSARAQTPCWHADLAGPCVVVLGNESVGLSAEARAACDELVRVPMHGGAHSFNVTVAAGIVLYERERQRSMQE